MNKIAKLISLFMALFLVNSGSFAQTSGAIITTQPASFTGEDQVKIIIDVSNVPNLAGQDPLYVWTWFPNEPAPGNGQWTNSNEARKLTKEGPNKWSWTITPKDFYGVEAASITEIKFLVKAKSGDGERKTDDIVLKVAPLTYVATDFRTFPRVVSPSDVVTIYLDQTLASDLSTQRMTPAAAKISLYSDAGTMVGVEKTITLKKEGDKLYSFILIPTQYFGVSAAANIVKMKVTYVGKIVNTSGGLDDVTSVVYEKAFDNLK